MKKFLMGCGVSVLVLIALVIGALFLAYSAADTSTKAFFGAVLSSEKQNVKDLMHPVLTAKVEEPVLEAWMKAVKSKLGNFVGVAKSDFSASTKYENGVKITETKGTVNFEKGTATSRLILHDGKIVEFEIVSENLKPEDWLNTPEVLAFYREKGKQFLTDLLSDKTDAAFAMMHENLQKKMPLDNLKAAMPGVKERFGALKSITFESEKFESGGDVPRLDVLYKVVCEKGETKGSVGFQFLLLKGHLISFNVPAEK